MRAKKKTKKQVRNDPGASKLEVSELLPPPPSTPSPRGLNGKLSFSWLTCIFFFFFGTPWKMQRGFCLMKPSVDWDSTGFIVVNPKVTCVFKSFLKYSGKISSLFVFFFYLEIYIDIINFNKKSVAFSNFYDSFHKFFGNFSNIF